MDMTLFACAIASFVASVIPGGFLIWSAVSGKTMQSGRVDSRLEHPAFYWACLVKFAFATLVMLAVGFAALDLAR